MKLQMLFLLSFLVSALLFGQDDPVSIIPEKPVIGKSVTIIYNPKAKDCRLKNAKEIRCIWGGLNPDKPQKMVLKEGLWSCSITLNDTALSLVRFRFDSDAGSEYKKTNPWCFIVYDSSGKPLKNAHLELFKNLSFIDRNQQEINIDSLCLDELQKELAIYPDNFNAKIYLYSYQIHKSSNPDSIRKIAVNEVMKRYEKFMDDPKYLESLLGILGCALGDVSKYYSVEQKLAGMNPKFKSRRDNNREYYKIAAEKDRTKKKYLLKKICNGFS